MRLIRYRGRHLRRRKRSGTVVVGTAATVWLTASPARAGTYEVAPGETLSGIAARYGTTVERLAAANGIRDPDFIVAGRRLSVPGSVGAGSSHVVVRGETLSDIAARYGTSVAALARANRIKDPNLIIAGTTLSVPGAGSAVSAASTAPAAVPAEDVGAIIGEQAAAHGVDSSLAKAVAWQESGWQQDVVSKAGAVGVMQVMPGTGRYVNRSLGGGDLHIRNARDNVHAGVMYLDHLLDTEPSEEKALASYYAGPGAVDRRLNRDQRHYVKAVEAHKPRF